MNEADSISSDIKAENVKKLEENKETPKALQKIPRDKNLSKISKFSKNSKMSKNSNAKRNPSFPSREVSKPSYPSKPPQ